MPISASSRRALRRVTTMPTIANAHTGYMTSQAISERFGSEAARGCHDRAHGRQYEQRGREPSEVRDGLRDTDIQARIRGPRDVQTHHRARAARGQNDDEHDQEP